jgi:glycosyltransferase involved in cell wall biosynthesis
MAPFFSIVIPTYNEELDINETLNHCLALEGNFEVLVIDDSTDDTPAIVSGFEDSRIRLICPTEGGGRCEARNRGIVEARGEVIVLLNADVHLAPDFLTRLQHHYRDGADYVLVAAKVKNYENLFARYIECAEVLQPYFKTPEEMNWTEGFSVRKSKALEAGLFPTGYPVRIVAGEDGYFGASLRRVGSLGRYDSNIVVVHISPSSFTDFWRVRRGRGEGIPQVRHFFQKWRLSHVLFRDTISFGFDLIQMLLIVPVVFKGWRMSRVSHRGTVDTLPFAFVWAIERAAIHCGVWGSARRILLARLKVGK